MILRTRILPATRLSASLCSSTTAPNGETTATILYYNATADTDFELKVERLRDELAKLRQEFNLWQNKILRAFAVVFVLLALIDGSVWWFGYGQHRYLLQLSAGARHIIPRKSAPSC
jgi:hypothetical protein